MSSLYLPISSSISLIVSWRSFVIVAIGLASLKILNGNDRADVIVPASSIYLAAMECADCPSIFVPDLGLKDGILKMLFDRYKGSNKA